MIGTQFGRKLQRYVNGEKERATDGGDAADNVGAVDGSAVPCITGSVGSRDPNKRVVAIVSGNGDGFVEEPEVTFDTDGFVIAFRGGVESNLQDIAHGFEDGEKVASRVDDDHAAHTELEKELGVEDSGEIVGREQRNRLSRTCRLAGRCCHGSQ